MHDDLIERIDALFPHLQLVLEQLVRIPSVSAAGYDPDEVQRSAEATRVLLQQAGAENVRLLEIPGAHPAVYGEVAGPEGAPTVLLYAHHDVQPPGPAEDWQEPPFEPRVHEGRLYGRGAADDKSGIIIHLGALGAHDGSPPVNVKFFIEGEEEIGSDHLAEYIDQYADMLAADVIVIADTGNFRTGTPTLTTSLRGLVDCYVEVKVLEGPVHSGLGGGIVPDALVSLSRIIASLHNDDGSVAVAGRVGYEPDPAFDHPEAAVRSELGVVDSVNLIGTGSLASRTWTRPSISVLAIDAPPVAEAINQIVPSARAKVSMRIAPGDDPQDAVDALMDHLRAHAPWGVEVDVTFGSAGEAFSLDTSGPGYDAFRAAFAEAWGSETLEVGVGGSIPFVAAFAKQYPDATILLTGAADDKSRPHAPNESVDLNDLRNAALAEAIALRLLADTT
jgi:acetylornithine deacetylase/succinyl-diaminopimelate desuccinylase-like protein